MIEHVIGGILLVLFFLMCMFLPQKLVAFSINIAEWIKPGIWYTRSIRKNVKSRMNMDFFYTAILFMAGVYFGMLHAYPFLISLWK